jgi:hypothetical protein
MIFCAMPTRAHCPPSFRRSRRRSAIPSGRKLEKLSPAPAFHVSTLALSCGRYANEGLKDTNKTGAADYRSARGTGQSQNQVRSSGLFLQAFS